MSDNKKPTVSRDTLRRKIREGLAETELRVVGWTPLSEALRPLVAYLERRGVEVK